MSAQALQAGFLDFTARRLWRLARPWLRHRLTTRCARCILPETCEPLNEEGVCRSCQTFARAGPAPGRGREQLQARLDELLRAHAGHSRGWFDALVLISGGKDSAYLLHRMVREYPGLRLLTVLVDNGFMSPYALANARRLVRRFGLPHLTLHPDAAFVKKVFRHALTHLACQRGYSLVDLMDGYLTFDHAKHLAARMEIPLILCGISKVQAEHVFGPTEVEFPPERERAPLRERGGIVLREVFSAEEMKYWFDGSRWPPERVPRFVLPFTVWDPGEEDVLSEVERLGLIAKGRSRPLLTNHALIPVIGLAEVARFGFCSWEVEFARMVREGKSERAYWLALFEMLEYAAKTGRFIGRSVERTLARLDLTMRDIRIVQG